MLVAKAMSKQLDSLLKAGTAAGASDQQLLDRFITRGDESAELAFAALVARHGLMVLGVCRGLLRDQHAAEDAFQATFLVLAQRADLIRDADRLGPWLHGVALRTARKVRARRIKDGPTYPQIEAVDVSSSPDQRSLAREEAEALHAALSRLPKKYRDPIVFCDLQGLTHNEAAHRLRLSAGALSMRITRARRLLRDRLTRRGFAPFAVLGVARHVGIAVRPSLEAATVRAAVAGAVRRAPLGPLTGIVSFTQAVYTTIYASRFTLLAAVLLAAVCASVLGSWRLVSSVRPRRTGPLVQAVAATKSVDRPTPTLPAAVIKLPDWISPDAPFDAAAFFQTPPPGQNASPLYLDALFEFSPDLAACLPDGDDRVRRSKATETRVKRFFESSDALRREPVNISDSALDEMLRSFDEGYRKLDEAQRRPNCTFESGIGITARIPHVHAARRVSQVSGIRLRRFLARGDIARAIREVELNLRLARDLRPRGSFIAQLEASGIDRVVCREFIVSILGSRQLGVEDCKSLLAVVEYHEAHAIDGYSEGLRDQYLQHVKTVRDLIFEQGRLAAELRELKGLDRSGSVVRSVVEPVVAMVARPGAGAVGNRPQPAPAFPSWPADVDAQVAKSNPQDLARQVEKLNGYYRSMLVRTKLPYAIRLRRLPDPVRELAGPDLLSRIVAGFRPALWTFTSSEGRELATLRATECVIALRLAQLKHADAVLDLEAAVRQAGRSSIPFDPFDGKPLRLARVQGDAVVYSVGSDGHDDQGLIDSQNDNRPGDLLFRLPRAAQVAQ